MSRPTGSKNKTRKTTTVTTTAYGNLNEMAHDVRGLLRSVINQDNKYSMKEATVVSKLYGAELSRMKLQVDIHKINTKISAKSADVNEILSLNG